MLPGATQTAAPVTAAVGAGAKVVPVIPFTRASLMKSAYLTAVAPIAIAAAALTPGINNQILASGFLRRIRLSVVGTTAGNAAAVAFNADGPFNVLQQVFMNQPNGNSLIQTIDGFDLYVLNKYFALGVDKSDPLADPGFSVVTGAGATGGSFAFNLFVPCEVDPRDGLGALTNMAANQSYLLQAQLATTAQLYTTAPTNPPVVSVTATMEYYSAPAAATDKGIPQQSAPTPVGSLSMIQVQTPAPIVGATQKQTLVNVGNAIRVIAFIARTAAGVRTEVDFPATSQIKYLGDVLRYFTKIQWNEEMARRYGYGAGKTAAPTLNSLDNGVFIFSDPISQGGAGGDKISCSANRDRLLLTDSGTLLEFEAVTAWGGAVGAWKVITNSIQPSSLEALFHPFVN